MNLQTKPVSFCLPNLKFIPNYYPLNLNYKVWSSKGTKNRFCNVGQLDLSTRKKCTTYSTNIGTFILPYINRNTIAIWFNEVQKPLSYTSNSFSNLFVDLVFSTPDTKSIIFPFQTLLHVFNHTHMQYHVLK